MKPDPIFFYRPEELARLLKLSETTVRRLIRRGDIMAVTLGRQHRVPHSELARMLREAGFDGKALPPSPWQALGQICKFED